MVGAPMIMFLWECCSDWLRYSFLNINIGNFLMNAIGVAILQLLAIESQMAQYVSGCASHCAHMVVLVR